MKRTSANERSLDRLRRHPADRRLEVVRVIRERIRSGDWIAGQRLPSERELAGELSVSRSCVQEAIRELETAGFVSRIRNCRPTVARSLPSSGAQSDLDRNQVAVWIQPDLQDPGAASMLQGIRAVLAARGYQLLIGCPADRQLKAQQQAEAEFLRGLPSNRAVSGAIVWDMGGPDFSTTYGALAEAGIPVVFIDREPSTEVKADVVATNHRMGATKVVEHLIELGHRKIAMVVNDEAVSSVRDRIEGYRSALREAEIPERDDFLIALELAEGRDSRAAIAGAVDRLLRMPDRPTAIFAVNDGIALALETELARRGIAVPGDVSLAGFDWIMRWLPSGGSLTTVAQPYEHIGRAAAERLLSRIESTEREPFRQILLEAALVVKASTGGPPPTRRVPVDASTSLR